MELVEIHTILDTVIFPKYKRRLTQVEVAILTGVWRNETYESISAGSEGRYSVNYLKRDSGPKLWKMLSEVLGETVNKKSFRSVLENAIENHSAIAQAYQELTEANQPLNPSNQASFRTLRSKTDLIKQSSDWGDVADISEFRGRENELARLENWMTEERCRIIALLGFGGIGKSALIARTVKQVGDKFDFVIWRSLSYTPPPEDLLEDLFSFIPEHSSEQLGYEGKISLMMNFLRQHSCLLVFDGIESILREKGRAGRYRHGCEKYSELIRRIGEETHKSCLILVGREKPDDISLMEGEKLYVRSLRLKGLPTLEARKILESKGFTVSEQSQKWNQLIEQYGGNPFALKIVATAIYGLFNQNVSSFLSQGEILFDKIYDLVEEQINRLSSSERGIINWLSLNQEGVSIQSLRASVFSPETQRKFITALKSLKDRSLIEENDSKFSVQPMVKEYLIDSLVDRFYDEIIKNAEQNSNISELALNNYAIVESVQKGIEPGFHAHGVAASLLERLYIWYGGKEEVRKRLEDIVNFMKGRFSLKVGHSLGNLLGLLQTLKSQDLCHQESAHLTLYETSLRTHIWQSYFTSSPQNVNDFVEGLGDILSIAYSKDKQLLAMGGTEGRIHLWKISEDRQCLTEHSSWQGHESWIRTLVFSPDYSILVSGGNDHAIKFWSVESNERLEVLKEPKEKEWVRSIAFSPDGTLFAAASDDFLVRLWKVNFKDKRLAIESSGVLSAEAHTGRVRAIAFHPKKSLLASCSDDHRVKIWDCETFQCIHTLEEHKDRVRTVAFSSDGRGLASGGDDYTVRVWDTDNFDLNPKVLKEHSNKVRTVVFSEDSQLLASGGDDCLINVWSTDKYDLEMQLGLEGERYPGRIHCLQFSLDSQGLLSSSDNQTVRLWNVKNRQILRTIRGYTHGAQSAIFVNDQTLVTAHDDYTVRMWNLTQGVCSKILTGHTGRVNSLSAASEILVSASSDDCSARLWDVPTGQSLQSIQAPPANIHEIRCAVISPNSEMLAVAGDDACIKIWKIENKQIQSENSPVTLKGHTGWIRAIAFNSDGKLLASGGDDQLVRIWDTATMQLNCVSSKGHLHRVRCVTFSPDDRTLASSSDDGSIKIWNVSTGECIRKLKTNEIAGGIRSIAFSPKGQWLVSGSEDSKVRIWNLSDGSFEELSEKHHSGVLSVAFSPDGETLASSSLDGEVKIWDITIRKCQKRLNAR